MWMTGGCEVSEPIKPDDNTVLIHVRHTAAGKARFTAAYSVGNKRMICHDPLGVDNIGAAVAKVTKMFVKDVMIRVPSLENQDAELHQEEGVRQMVISAGTDV